MLGRVWNNEKSLHTAGGCVNLKNWNHQLQQMVSITYDPGIPLLGIQPNRNR